MPELAGVVPVFQMPYNEDHSIDFGTLNNEIEWILDAGADAIAFAMASELLRLTTAERHSVAEYVGKRWSSRGAVVVGVGAESTVGAVEFAKHAASSGGTALMAIPPVANG